MSHSPRPNDRREFHCEHCGGQILIPRDLPPTTGPCPHCAKTITSPELGAQLPKRRVKSKASKPSSKMEFALSPDGSESQKAPNEPIKLDASQHAQPPIRQKKSTQPKKANPTKPVVSRHPLAVDQSTGPILNDFEIMLIEETRRHKRKVITILTTLILAAGCATYLYLEYYPEFKTTADNTDARESTGNELTRTYIQSGWEKDARDVLRAYLAATTSYGKMPCILGGHPMLQEMETFYKGAIINDLDTPVEAFTVKPLSIQDHERGLFRMAFQANLEDLHLKKPGDFTNESLVYPDEVDQQPTVIHAFFKHTPNGLKLDWNIFAQTKYRTLLHFARQPNPRRKACFRVLIAQDKPASNQPTAYPIRYRIADPANPKDVIWASANENSQAAKQLDTIHWVDREQKNPVTRSATIELAWAGENDDRELLVHRFICWEFLGLGGEAPANAPRKD